MAYIGPSIETGFRQRFVYTATAGQTSFSGNDSVGISLTYTDSEYLDVYQNGVLLVPGSDYAATTGTTVVLVTGASLNDKVEMIAYQAFGVADTVSRADGGAFGGAVSMASTLTVTGAFTSQGIDDNADATAITIDSSENVAIGTTTVATGKLAVEGGIYLSGSSNFLRFGADSSTTTGVAIHRPAANTLAFVTASAEQMRISTDGEITKPKQPSFYAYPDGNIAVSNSTSLTTFAANAEIYDVGSNFNVSTYKFTAPVSGRYLIKWGFRLDGSDAGATYYYYRIYTSNRTYDQIQDITSDETYSAPNNIAIVDMDANDEAYLQYQQYSGTNNHATIVSDARLTYIQGILLG